MQPTPSDRHHSPRSPRPRRGPHPRAAHDPGPARRGPRAHAVLLALLVTLPLLPLAAPRADADEGMYLLHEAKRLPWPALRTRGLALTPTQLQGLAPAVVQLARGGTGSFVSPQGLIVTNHHVGYRCLVRLGGTTHPGILKRGYLAATRDKELPCRGYDALVVVRVEDATDRVLGRLRTKLTPDARAVAIRVARRRLEASCEKRGGPGRVCSVDPLNGGARFTLSVYQRVRDVRLVYAPPKALGKFGGDVDNWRYPRHTADFTFLRAYVAPDGAPKPFAKANVPFRPKRWLKVATSGVRRGQLTLVLGFPGHTRRHATLARARFWVHRLMARKAKLFRGLLPRLPHAGLGGRRYAGLDAGLNNAAKYYEDSIRQFARFHFLGRKARQQQTWIHRAGARANALRALLDRIDGIYKRYDPAADRMLLLGYLQSRVVRSLSTAVDIVRWSRLRRVADLRREGERYRDKNLYRVRRQADTLTETTTPAGERRLLLGMMRFAQTLPPGQRPKVLTWLRRYGLRALHRIARRARRRHTSLAAAYRKATGGLPLPGPTAHATPHLELTPTSAARGSQRPSPRPHAGSVASRRHGARRHASKRHRLRRHGARRHASKRRSARRRAHPAWQRALLAKVDPVAAAIDLIYARTRLYPRSVTDAKAVARTRRARRRWLKASAAKVRRARDPLLQLARQVTAELDALRAGPGHDMERVVAPILRPRLVTRFIRPHYWDANFTLRLSYGTVKDYREVETVKARRTVTVWRYLSRLTWLVRKGRGRYPFLVPKRLLQIYRRRDFGRWVDPRIHDVPVNFTTTLDTTGGNSGSPVLNGRGELVGLLFDGTPESILSDWQYLDRAQRSICVDIRFVLFLADRMDHARGLLRELGIRP